VLKDLRPGIILIRIAGEDLACLPGTGEDLQGQPAASCPRAEHTRHFQPRIPQQRLISGFKGLFGALATDASEALSGKTAAMS